LPFVERFGLQKLHLFGQEGVTSPCEDRINASEPAAFERWVEMALALCEREELLSFSSHLMYVGRKV
jgi:S-adenosylmethionine-dependent methyltransferase